MKKVNVNVEETQTRSDGGATITKRVREIRVNYSGPKRETVRIKDASDVAQFIRSVLPDNSREHFVAVYLDAAHQIIGYAVTTTGTANACMVHPREIFQRAILLGAVALVVGHNHPSGQTEPSDEDKKITVALKETGEVIGQKLLDHVIVTDDGFRSFSDAGLII